jgi:hypothetical protein
MALMGPACKHLQRQLFDTTQIHEGIGRIIECTRKRTVDRHCSLLQDAQLP